MMISDNDIDMLVHNVWCPDCEMWLNGPEQFGEHKGKKKHKKNLRKNIDKHQERGGRELFCSSRSRSPRR
jgi:hypothetical protein